jgi:peptidoglycan hydrolase-like protein with peptidoglycan-binding domain
VASRTAPSSVGIAAGLVYGDGTLDQQGARVALCGAKNEALLDHFPTEQVRHRYHYDTHAEAHTIVTGLPRSWKNCAPHDEGPAHTYGWLAGYFAADGRVGENGQCELNSADEWRLEEARRVALSLGITTSPITSIKRETNYSGEVSTLYSLRIDPRSLDSSFFLIPEHRERWNGEMRKAPPDWSVVSVTETDRVEEVFCAVVPDVESFAIEDFILTGNCRKITGGSGYSLHAYGIAADLNWSTNPYGSRLVTDMPGAMIADIKAIRTNNGKQVFRWGGDYKGNKDAMHFEVICTPADLATGLQGGPTPTSHPVDLAAFLQQTVACSANTFRRGETGACIGVIQRICSTKFAQSISVDGDFGPATEQAVKAVQRQRGVTDDGIVGPQTWAKMME